MPGRHDNAASTWSFGTITAEKERLQSAPVEGALGRSPWVRKPVSSFGAAPLAVKIAIVTGVLVVLGLAVGLPVAFAVANSNANPSLQSGAGSPSSGATFEPPSSKMPTLLPENKITTANRYMNLLASKRYMINEGHKRIAAPILPTQADMDAHVNGAEFLATSGTFLAKSKTLRGVEHPAGTRILVEEYRGQIADYVYEEQRAGYVNPLDYSNFTLVALNAQADMKTFDGHNMFLHAGSFNVERAALMDDTGTCYEKYAEFNTLCKNENPFNFTSRKIPTDYPWVLVSDFAIDDASPLYDFEDIKNAFCLLKYSPVDATAYVSYLMSLAPGYEGAPVAPYTDLWRVSTECYKFVPTESKADFPVRIGEWFSRWK